MTHSYTKGREVLAHPSSLHTEKHGLRSKNPPKPIVTSYVEKRAGMHVM